MSQASARRICERKLGNLSAMTHYSTGALSRERSFLKAEPHPFTPQGVGHLQNAVNITDTGCRIWHSASQRGERAQNIVCRE